MSRRKKLHWIVIFSALLLATAYMGIGLVNAAPGNSVANAVKGAGFEKAGKVLLIGEEESNGHNWLKRFAHLVEKQTICTVNEAQYSRLSEKYDVSLEPVSVSGNTVSAVKISGEKVKKNDVLDLLRGDGDKLECKGVKTPSYFYLLFSANVS